MSFSENVLFLIIYYLGMFAIELKKKWKSRMVGEHMRNILYLDPDVI